MTWVDYAQLRHELDIVEVMRDLGVELHGSGEQRKGPCPFDDCRESDVRSLSVNVRKGLWKCWRCKATGNVIGFAARMQGLDPDDNAAFRTTALGLQERYGVTPPKRDRNGQKSGDRSVQSARRERPRRERRRPTSQGGRPKADEVVNEPLDFELKELDPKHPSIGALGLSPATVEYFGFGYCGRQGMFHGRIAIPIHNPGGRLIAYAGRIADAKEVGPNQPEYLFPERERIRKRDNKKLVFDRSRLVYNAHRVKSPVAKLVVVDDLRHVWMVHDAGEAAVVAPLGDVCDEQVDAFVELVEPYGVVWFLIDAGSPLKTLVQVAKHRATRWIWSSDVTVVDNARMIP